MAMEHPEHDGGQEQTDQPTSSGEPGKPSRARRFSLREQSHLGSTLARLEDISARLGDTFARLKSIYVTSIRIITQGWQMVRPDVQPDGYPPAADLRAALMSLDLKRLGLILLVLLAIGYLISGFYTVQPGEVAVVRRFGKVLTPPVQEGLSYRLPWPFETERIVNISTVRRKSVGLPPKRKRPRQNRRPIGATFQVLTGDVNLVDFEVIVQYQVNDPAAYLFNLNVPSDQLVESAVQFAVTRLGGSMGIDALLTTERLAMQRDLRQEVQSLLDQYGSGLAVVGINLQKVYPSFEAAPAFRDVSSAMEDKARAVNEAEAYRNSVIPEARGQADSLIAEAESQATLLVDQATGANASFNAIVDEYHTNSRLYGEDVTRARLYLEQLEKSLPRLQTYVVQRGEQVNLRLLKGSQVMPFPPLPTGR